MGSKVSFLGGNDYETLDDTGKKFRKRQLWWLVVLGVLIVGVLALILGLALGISLSKSDDSDDSEDDGDFTALANAVQIADLMATLNDLQGIANNYNGSRSIATGYNASAAYIFDQLKQMNYTPQYQYFTLNYATVTAPPLFAQVSPKPTTYSNVTDYKVFRFSPATNGPLTAAVTYIPNLGCSAADYANFPAGNIAMTQRSSLSTQCTNMDKVQLAQNNGASAIIIHAGSDLGSGIFTGSITQGSNITIPAITAVFAVGDAIQCTLGRPNTTVTVTIEVNHQFAPLTTMNVYADTKDGSDSDMVVIGSHLDSVDAGPGLNDNASGSALNLRLATEWAKLKLKAKNKIRFAWWSAEEWGLLGATAYVNWQVEQKLLSKTALYLNFDMTASPNFQIGVYNGSDSTLAPAGSVKLMQLFENYFSTNNEMTVLSPFNGRSDYGPFIAQGVPAGGLAAGAEGIKDMTGRTMFGGYAQTPYDPCYHLDCDTIDNINQDALLKFTKAAATVLENMATRSNVRKYIGRDK